MDAVVATLQCSVPLARVEFLDEVQMMACNKYSDLHYPETPHLFLGMDASRVCKHYFFTFYSKENVRTDS